MQTKFVVDIDNSVLEKAQRYAQKKSKTLSELIEAYLRKVSQKEKDFEISENVKSMMGKFKLSEDIDYKDEITKYLEEKYLD